MPATFYVRSIKQIVFFNFLFFCSICFANSLKINNLEGFFEIRLAYSSAAQEQRQYVLKTSDNQTYYLHFADQKPAALKTGDQIRIKQATRIKPDSKELLVQAAEIEILQARAFAIPESLGDQKVVVFLVNFQDQAGNKPWSVADVTKTVFTDINNMFYESSYRQTTLSGRVIGWFTLPLLSTASCDAIIDGVVSMGENAARQAGIDLSPYRRRVYMFPLNRNCSWAGLGTLGIGQNYSIAWINGDNAVFLTGHELGHNLGADHARFLRCPGSSTEGNCTIEEYGDRADIMGGGGSAHFNAYHKSQLGWLGYLNSPPIQTVSASGTFTLEAYETFSRNLKALKILKRNNPDNTKDYYYVEFRQPIGFDSHLNCANCDFTKGVLVHQGNSLIFSPSDLLDMSPSTTDSRLVALLPGQSFTDAKAPNGGVTITLNSISSSAANVSVRFGSAPPPPQCVRAQPTLNIIPNTVQWIRAGQTARYNVTMTNRDSGQCGASSFNFSLQNPSVCLKSSLSAQNITVAPGATIGLTLTIVASNIADPGVFTVNVTAKNSSAPTFTNTKDALLGIFN